jgi:hypothetical protein
MTVTALIPSNARPPVAWGGRLEDLGFTGERFRPQRVAPCPGFADLPWWRCPDGSLLLNIPQFSTMPRETVM